MIVTLVPCLTTINCGHAQSKSSKQTKKIGKKLARYNENQTYLNYTGYDPKKPLSDYHLDWITYHSFDEYWSDLRNSWGDQEKNKLLFYHKKWSDFQKNYPKKSDSPQWFISSISEETIHEIKIYPTIPSLELYDFVHALQWKSYLIEHNAGHPERIARSNITFPYKSDWKN